MHQTIGEYFRFARVSSQLTVRQVSEMGGVIGSHELVALEADLYRPTVDTLYSLVNVYNVNPDEFIELLYKLASGGPAGPAAGEIKTKR